MADSLRRPVALVRVVEVGQTEGMSVLVTEHTDLDHPAATVLGRHDGVAVDPDLAAAHCVVVRLVDPFRPVVEALPVGPDAATPTFAADLRMDDADEVDPAVVVTRVGNAVVAVVVELTEVDGGVVEIQDLVNELTGVGEVRVESVDRSRVVIFLVRHLNPVVDRADQVECAVGDLVVVLRHRSRRPRAVEEHLLEVLTRERVCTRVVELAEEDRHGELACDLRQLLQLRNATRQLAVRDPLTVLRLPVGEPDVRVLVRERVRIAREDLGDEVRKRAAVRGGNRKRVRVAEEGEEKRRRREGATPMVVWRATDAWRRSRGERFVVHGGQLLCPVCAGSDLDSVRGAASAPASGSGYGHVRAKRRRVRERGRSRLWGKEVECRLGRDCVGAEGGDGVTCVRRFRRMGREGAFA